MLVYNRGGVFGVTSIVTATILGGTIVTATILGGTQHVGMRYEEISTTDRVWLLSFWFYREVPKMQASNGVCTGSLYGIQTLPFRETSGSPSGSLIQNCSLYRIHWTFQKRSKFDLYYPLCSKQAIDYRRDKKNNQKIQISCFLVCVIIYLSIWCIATSYYIRRMTWLN